ncbi:hypothetical protein [Methylomagnum sp.]
MLNDNEFSPAPDDSSVALKERRPPAERGEEHAHGATGTPRERHRPRRPEEHERQWHGRDPRKKVWIFILSLALGVETLALIVAYTQMMMVENDRRTLTQAIQAEAGELKVLQPQFVSLKQDVARQVKARSPGLRPLQLDHVIPVDQDSVANITFTATGKDDSKVWEYKAVMANEAADPLYVRLDLLLFDEGGVQIGRSSLLKNEGKDATEPVLHAGEVRSFYGAAELNQEENPPVYFRLARRPGRLEQASAKAAK